MQRSARFLILGIPLFMTATGAALSATPEEVPVTQDLVNVKAARPVQAAQWIRQPDAYILRLDLDPGAFPIQVRATSAANPDPRPVDVSRPPPPDSITTPDGTRAERGSFFIGNTVANLRGTDPAFHCGRRLTLVDGRRVAQQQPARQPPTGTPLALNQKWPTPLKERHVDAWLLKPDGTQILPVLYS